MGHDPVPTTAIEGLRPVRDEDADAVVALVAAAYAEYPGCVLDLPGVDDDLPALASRWTAAGGGGWVVQPTDQRAGPAPGEPRPAACSPSKRSGDGRERPPEGNTAACSPSKRSGDGRERPPEGITALVGWVPSGPGTVELKRLYVAASARRRGLGSALVELVAATAAAQGARWLELWSDTRFADAHRLYEAHGFARLPGTRDLHDPSDTTERHYVRDLHAG